MIEEFKIRVRAFNNSKKGKRLDKWLNSNWTKSEWSNCQSLRWLLIPTTGDGILRQNVVRPNEEIIVRSRFFSVGKTVLYNDTSLALY